MVFYIIGVVLPVLALFGTAAPPSALRGERQPDVMPMLCLEIKGKGDII